MKLLRATLAIIPMASFTMVLGHEGHDDHPARNQVPLTEDWASIHMAEEHHINTFDAASFFNLHDYDSSGSWSRDDILKTYGLKDRSTAHVSAADRETAVARILAQYDRDRSGTVERDEFLSATAKGVRMPDLGYGPGHHGDDEYEYEIHHFEKFHGADTKEEDLIHPEDIEHFKHHDEIEHLEERNQAMDALPIVEHNIPAMFLIWPQRH